MQLKDQVCNLDLSRKLKELGVKQESLFYWQEVYSMGKLVDVYLIQKESKLIERPEEDVVYSRFYSAFTVAELGELLPKEITLNKSSSRYGLEFEFADREILAGHFYDGWIYFYSSSDDNIKFSYNQEDWVATEADARAKCLIYLLENHLIKGEL